MYGELITTQDEKQLLLQEMLRAICVIQGYTDTQDFNEVYARLKQLDAKLEKQDFIKEHPARVTIKQLIEKAEKFI